MPESKDKVKPFSTEYVMGTTARHVLKSVDLSVEKTMGRIPDFEPDTAKAQEVFKTLTSLQAFKQHIQSFVDANPQLFKGN